MTDTLRLASHGPVIPVIVLQRVADAVPLAEALLWPLAGWVLLAPQRRPPDRDENRPL